MLCWLSTSVPSQSNTTSRNARAPAPEFMSWAPWDANITHPERKAPRRAAGRGPAFGTKSHAQEMVIPSAPSREGLGPPFDAQGDRTSGVWGKRVSVRVGYGGRTSTKKNKQTSKQ